MKSQFCVCGHNYFSHEEKYFSQFFHITGKYPPITKVFSPCRIETCLCQNFNQRATEQVRIRKGRKKKEPIE